MPKVDGTQLPDRLRTRIEELEAGKEVASRDIKAVLNDEQLNELEDAWAEQQQLRKQTRAATKDEQEALGWKTIRQVRLEMLKKALVEAHKNVVPAFKKKMSDELVRQGRIYFDAYGVARNAGKDVNQAKNWANNELTRAGLRRLDGANVAHKSKRDQEVWKMEADLIQKYKDSLSANELEDYEMYEEIGNSKHTTKKKKNKKR